ncbi:hypothetical protein Peur_072386 [Populus x canadensis]
MTINKSQGQSLKTVGVFLKEQVFTHGQLYVALSRVTSRKGLKIISCNNQGEPSHYAKNIVYKDIINFLFYLLFFPLRIMALSIQNIKKYTFYTSLRARVCHVWIPKLNGQTSSFNCLFADNMVSSSFALWFS